MWRGGPCPKDRWELLGSNLRAESREVVVDLGSSPFLPSSGRAVLLAAADVSLLVIRPCYLALRLALQSPFRPTGVVLLRDEGRALKAADVEAALGVGVVAEIAVDPGVARAVDSGLLNTRLPRALERSARRAA